VPTSVFAFYLAGEMVAIVAEVVANPGSAVPNLGASGAIVARPIFVNGLVDGIAHIMILDSLPHRLPDGCAFECDEPGDVLELHNIGSAIHLDPELFDAVACTIEHRAATAGVWSRKMSWVGVHFGDKFLLFYRLK